jgi:cytochrome P450
MTQTARSTHPAGRQELPSVLGGFDLTDQARWAQGVPYDVFARLRREAPVLRHPPGHSADGEPFWVLSRHADISFAAADPAFSAQTGGGRAGGGTHLDDLVTGVHVGVLLPMTDDPRHELIADVVRPTMHDVIGRGIEDELRKEAAALVDEALGEPGYDFAGDVAGRFAVRTLSIALGVPRSEWDRLTGWLDAVVGIVGRRSGVADEAAKQVNQAVFAHAKAMMAAKRSHPAHDLTTALAVGDIPEGHGEPPMSEWDREANYLMLLQSGSEQPRNTLAGGLAGLAGRPDQWQALRADRSLVPGAVEELLRWAPPNPYNRRTATRDVQVGDTLIREGEKVTLWWASANRDETVFPDADRFDIRRSPNPHVSFGHGTHHCLGDGLARLEMRVLLEELLDRVSEIRLDGPVLWSPSNKHAVVVGMPVTLVP